MKNILLILITALLFTACRKDKSSPPEFRIQNDTPFRIESAVVKLGNSQNSYSAIEPGRASEFKVFSDYDYPYVKLRVNNRDIEFAIMPIEGGQAGPGENLKSTGVIGYIAGTDSFNIHFKN